MEKISRSRSSREGPERSKMYNLRSYSTSDYNLPQIMEYDSDKYKEVKIKKGNKSKIRDFSSSSSSSSSSKSWSFNIDPELQRKKRIASYKAYGVEGKMKGSLRKSFRWIKDTCNNVVHGFW